MPSISAIHLHEVETQHPRPVQSAKITASGGIDGDSHERAGRKVLLVSSQVLTGMQLAPGDLREQLTIDGMDVNSLPEGSRLKIGAVSAVVQGECAPCLTIGAYLEVPDPEGFRGSLTDKRGRFVVFDPSSAGQTIHVGDEVEVEGQVQT